MSAKDLVQQKMDVLPLEVQQQVLEYVDFLAHKYSVEEDEELLKRFLLRRAEMAKNERKISADDLRKKVLKKYGSDV
ncbi:MAG: hypothetical protein AAGJ18_22025 [Bacteroidota bacterium]